jgi:hypothetical protein
MDFEVGTFPLHNTPTSTRTGSRQTLHTISQVKLNKINKHHAGCGYDVSNGLLKKSLTSSSRLNYETNNASIANFNSNNYNNRIKALKNNVNI